MTVKRRDDDTLHAVVVIAALAVLAIVAWVGGRRLYGRWNAGRPEASPSAPKPVQDDGVDRPPASIPPLALVGISPPVSRAKNRPAARPMPAITPDRE